MKKTQLISRLGNNHGQALIEYVLMVIISVSLVLALMNQIFKPFGTFIESYMGKYVECLLEYGELPTLGGDQASPVTDDSECNSKFQAATLAGGRPPNGGQSDSDGSNSGNSSEKKDGSGSDRSGGGSSGSYAGSSSRGGGSYINSRRRPSAGVESGSEAGGGKVVEIALDGGGSGSFFSNNNDSIIVRRIDKTSTVPLSGLTESERKRLAKKAAGTSKTMATGESISSTPKKMVVKTPDPKTIIEEEKPLTIGNFIRYLFIAALVIALVIFIGGQALQMSKSYEK